MCVHLAATSLTSGFYGSRGLWRLWDEGWGKIISWLNVYDTGYWAGVSGRVLTAATMSVLPLFYGINNPFTPNKPLHQASFSIVH